jgi:hypothetical protein
MPAEVRRRKLFAVWIAACVAAVAGSVVPARADTVTVYIDQAQVLHLPDEVATIVIGNPLIADASLQRGGLLVITGKGFGETNLLALDRGGQIIMDKTVHVLGPATADLVTVYKGIERESYSCAPECERRLTLGDEPKYFNDTLVQIGARVGQAQGGAASGGGSASK